MGVITSGLCALQGRHARPRGVRDQDCVLPRPCLPSHRVPPWYAPATHPQNPPAQTSTQSPPLLLSPTVGYSHSALTRCAPAAMPAAGSHPGLASERRVVAGGERRASLRLAQPLGGGHRLRAGRHTRERSARINARRCLRLQPQGSFPSPRLMTAHTWVCDMGCPV